MLKLGFCCSVPFAVRLIGLQFTHSGSCSCFKSFLGPL